MAFLLTFHILSALFDRSAMHRCSSNSVQGRMRTVVYSGLKEFTLLGFECGGK